MVGKDGMRDVFKNVIRIEDSKDRGECIFKCSDGKVCVLDAKENVELADSIMIGDTVGVWVVKETDVIRFVRISMDGILFGDLLQSIPYMALKDLWVIAGSDKHENMTFSNSMYNDDIVFNNHVMKSTEEDGHLSKLFTDTYGSRIDSEEAEYASDYAALLDYLYHFQETVQ